MLLEVLAQERLVGEVEFFGYLLDAFRGVLQQYAQLKDDVAVYPVIRRTPADALDDV